MVLPIKSSIVLKASDKFQHLTHLPTREIGSLLFVRPWCTLLVGQPCLHCTYRKKNGAIRLKLRSRDHNSTNYKQTCAEDSVTINNKDMTKVQILIDLPYTYIYTQAYITISLHVRVYIYIYMYIYTLAEYPSQDGSIQYG